MASTTISVRGVKINTLVDPKILIAANLVPPEPAPAGNPVLWLQVGDSPLNIRVPLSGKSVRKAVKAIGQHGVEGCHVLLQGNLVVAPGGDWTLDCAGMTVTAKATKVETTA